MSRQQIPVQVPVKLEWKVDHIFAEDDAFLDKELEAHLNNITSKGYQVSNILENAASYGVIVISVKATASQIAQAGSPIIGG